MATQHPASFSVFCFLRLQESFYLSTFSEQSEKKVIKIDSVYSYHSSLCVMWPFHIGSQSLELLLSDSENCTQVDSRTVDLDTLDLQITKEIVGY